MGSQRFWRAIVSILALSAVGPHSFGVWAQEASCLPGFEWNQNALGQDPCTIASRLEAACRGVGSFLIPPLGSGEYYSPPLSTSSGDLQCECNTVNYSLYGSCSSCQNGTVISWKSWTTYCINLVLAQYPYDIPIGTEVPRWAYINVTTLPNETYSDLVAMAIGANPEATPSRTSLLSSSSTSFMPSSAPPPVRTSNSPGPKNQTGVIAGSVVGGVVGLILLAIAAYFFIEWLKGRRREPRIKETGTLYGERGGSPTLTEFSTDVRSSAYQSNYPREGQSQYGGQYDGTPGR